MPLYKYRPEISREALQWDPSSPREMVLFLKAHPDDPNFPLEVDDRTEALYVKTPLGQIAAKPGDYILKDDENPNHLRSCTKENFEKLFQPCCKNH